MDLLKLDEVKKHKIDILIIISLFLIAFGIRMITSETFPGIYGFDPFNHARVIRYVIKNGSAPMRDPFAYWPEGRNFYSFSTPVHIYTSALWYKIFALITTGSAAFNQTVFNTFYSMVGPLYGSLAVIGLFLIGLMARNRKAGLMSALGFIATTSTLYRTMYGFSEEDPLGLMMYGLSIAAMIYALKKRSVKWGWLVGLAFGVYAISWATSVIPLAVIATYLVIDLIYDIIKKDYTSVEDKMKVTVSMIIPMFTPMLLFSSSKDLLTLAGQMFIATVAVLSVIALYVFKYRKMNSEENKKAKWYKYATGGIIGAAVIGLALGYDKLRGIIVWMLFKAPYQSSKLLKTVGEEHPATLGGVLSSLGYFSPIFLIGLIWLPIRYVINHKKAKTDLLIWLLGAVTFYLYINKAKMGYVFDAPAMAIVGIIMADMLKIPQWIKSKSKSNEVKLKWFSAAVLGLILILGFWTISKGIVVMEQYKGNYAPQSGWIAGLDHFASMPDKSKYVFMVWWDYGDWVAWRYMKVTLDGTNANPKKVMETAKILSDFRGNSTDAIIKRHEKMLKYWGITHIGIDRTLISCQKWGAVTYLGDNVCIPKEELKKWNISYPPVLEGPEQGCPPGTVYAGCMQGVYCHVGYDQAGNQEVICPLGRTNLVFTPKQWNAMVNTKWPGYNLELDTGKGIFRARVYARPDGYLMFFVDRRGRILTNAPANYMLGYRLFFQDPNITTADFAGDFWGNLVTRYHYPSKYRYVPDEEVVFYKLNWNKILNTTG